LITSNASIVFVALGATLSPTLGTMGFVFVPIVFVSALTSHLMGTYFDVPSDRLSYPYLAWRLGVPLSAIHDANAQTINKRGIDVLASLGEKKSQTQNRPPLPCESVGRFWCTTLDVSLQVQARSISEHSPRDST
jgi:hypothetical protein